MSYMLRNGFSVEVKNIENMNLIKETYGVPLELQSCHTAVVDGYVIEGHVPADAVTRLLAERPAVVGIAVPGMPLGAPGMEQPGVTPEPYDVLTFDAAGNVALFASYRP